MHGEEQRHLKVCWQGPSALRETQGFREPPAGHPARLYFHTDERSDTVWTVLWSMTCVSSPWPKEFEEHRGRETHRRNEIIRDVGVQAREIIVGHDTQIKFSSKYSNYILTKPLTFPLLEKNRLANINVYFLPILRMQREWEVASMSVLSFLSTITLTPSEHLNLELTEHLEKNWHLGGFWLSFSSQSQKRQMSHPSSGERQPLQLTRVTFLDCGRLDSRGREGERGVPSSFQDHLSRGAWMQLIEPLHLWNSDEQKQPGLRQSAVCRALPLIMKQGSQDPHHGNYKSLTHASRVSRAWESLVS